MKEHALTCPVRPHRFRLEAKMSASFSRLYPSAGIKRAVSGSPDSGQNATPMVVPAVSLTRETARGVRCHHALSRRHRPESALVGSVVIQPLLIDLDSQSGNLGHGGKTVLDFDRACEQLLTEGIFHVIKLQHRRFRRASP